MKLTYHVYFLYEAPYILVLETPEGTSALHLEAILNSEITIAKKQKTNKPQHGTKRLQKDHLFTSWKVKTSQSIALFHLSWERVHRVTQTFHYPVHVYNGCKYWFLGYRKILVSKQILNMESVNNENGLYLFPKENEEPL